MQACCTCIIGALQRRHVRGALGSLLLPITLSPRITTQCCPDAQPPPATLLHLQTNLHATPHPSCPFQAGFITGAAAAFAESPIDFYKSQIQVQIIRAKSDPAYKREFVVVDLCAG